MPGHLQIYLDGKLIRDEHITDIGTTPGLSFSTFNHEAQNGELIPLKLVITAQLSPCPHDHNTNEPCC
jgi:hypothetical protein